MDRIVCIREMDFLDDKLGHQIFRQYVDITYFKYGEQYDVCQHPIYSNCLSIYKTDKTILCIITQDLFDEIFIFLKDWREEQLNTILHD